MAVIDSGQWVPLAGRADAATLVGALCVDGNPGQAVLVEGEAGQGKTAVWELAVREAVAAGLLVLPVRAAQAETGMAFAGLLDLLDPITDRLAELEEPARAVLEIALLRRTAGATPPAERDIGVGLLRLLRRVIEDGPVLVAVDDGQWLDGSTAEVLAFALRRLGGGPIRVVVTRRTSRDEPQAWGDPVVEALAGYQFQHVRLNPLTPPEIAELVSHHTGGALGSDLVASIAVLADGNPYWALELAAALRTAPAGLAISTTMDGLGAVMASRLGRLGASALTALRVVAAQPRATWTTSRAVLAALVADPEGALDESILAGVVVDRTGRLRTSHPLLASAALDGLTPAARRRLHQCLAQVADEPEQKARHIALAAGGQADAAVAAGLSEGAEAARRRGASHAAAELSRLAAEMTPPGDAQDSARRLLTAAELAFAVGDLPTTCQLGEQFTARHPDDPNRPQLLPLLVEASYWHQGPPTAQRLVAEVLADRAAPERLLAAALSCAVDVGDGGGTPRADLAARAMALWDRLPEPDPKAMSAVLLCLADDHLDRGDGINEVLLARAAEIEQAASSSARWIPVCNRASSVAAYHRKLVDDLEGASAQLNRALATAHAHGDDSSLPALLGHLALTEFWAGNLVAASAAAEQGLEAAAQHGGVAPAALYAARGLIWATTGDLDAARTLAAQRLRLDRPMDKTTIVYRHLLGLCDLLAGRPVPAYEHLQAAYDLAVSLGIREPGRRQRLEGDLGQALIATGRLDRAIALADELIELGGRGSRPTVIGVGYRVAGLAAAAGGDLDSAVSALTSAVTAHQASPLRLELPRSRLALAQVHRRRRDRAAARHEAQRAWQGFSDLGAVPYAQLANAELTLLGTVSRGAPLTPGEQRVVELAIAGRSNRDIAAELFLSTRTVEGHLAAVYRKLGVRGRADLMRRHPVATGPGS